MGVEVPRAVVADVLQKLDQEEGLLDVVAAEAEVLVVAPQVLVVEVDVEQLARVPRLCHRVREIQPRHVLVRHLRVHTDHLRVVQRLDERQHVPDRRQVEVAARLVRLRLQRETQVVTLVDRILAQKVDRLLEPFSGLRRILGGVGLGAFPSAPEYVSLGPTLHAQIDRRHRLLQRVRPHLRVVARERAVAKGRVREQIGRRHRHNQALLLQRLLEIAHDAVALGRGRFDRDQVVVVEVDAPGAHLAQQLHQLHRRARFPHPHAERVAPGVADRPQAEAEFVFRSRCVGHRCLLAVALNLVFPILRDCVPAERRESLKTEN